MKNSTLFYSIFFILLYGSGYIGAKLGFPYAKPLVFLYWRFAISGILLALLAFLSRSAWPKTRADLLHVSISGIFLLCLFSVGTWISMDMGVSPAVSALIIALQPLSVSTVSYFLFKKEIDIKQWIGLFIGLLGVILVVGKQASLNSTYLIGVCMSFLGLVGLTVGNLYQKSFCTSMSIFAGGAIQSIVSAIICFILAVFFEPLTVKWSGVFIFSLFWMSIVVSIGAISFLYILLRRGESHNIASLFYLIPGVTAIIAYFVFGSVLDSTQIVGMLITMLGVALVNFNFLKSQRFLKK